MNFRCITRAIEAEGAKVKGSRFVGFASPVRSRKEALDVVASRRALLPQANHHCFAYSIAQPSEMFSSDDGEPHNTAGRPILQVLSQYDVQNVCIVVSRVFGGTKLGTGGLVRAYNNAAKYVMDAATIEESCTKHEMQLVVPVSFIASVKKTLHRYDGQITNLTIDGQFATFDANVPSTNAIEFNKILGEATNGRAITTN
ncbi:ABC transporter [Thraustotheca clavata]|uniref:ABC transporter n=1 Tax=Thraustotheca clavata TaxID=74557 RepID=A0A1V9ZX51_9STRA|nr:ABC transporter [Thraustotheca clavata]